MFVFFKMKVYLRWTKSSRCSFPFVFNVSEETTIDEICKMVIKENNRNDINPSFFIVKILAKHNTYAKNADFVTSFERVNGAYYFDFDAEL